MRSRPLLTVADTVACSLCAAQPGRIEGCWRCGSTGRIMRDAPDAPGNERLTGWQRRALETDADYRERLRLSELAAKEDPT